MSEYKVRRFWERNRVQVHFKGESMTEQSHRDSADINSIVQRYHRTGHITPPRQPAVYGDCTRFQQDLNDRINFAEQTVADANEALQALLAEREAASAAPPATPVATPPASAAPTPS